MLVLSTPPHCIQCSMQRHAATYCPLRQDMELQGHTVSLNADSHSTLRAALLPLLRKTPLVLLQQADAFPKAPLPIT